jgi:hypothetical protein
MKEGDILKIRAQRFLETAKDLYKKNITIYVLLILNKQCNYF